ncbi:MAG: DUF2784 domain-containing protein [Desulfobacteraceae bacterium]|nr:DUF2784 domain-containing protein [Desulfobacteraceae bacterium]
MIYRIAADLIVLIHFAFILFVVAGSFLVIKWHKVSLLHIPAAVWGVLIEFTGGICPLTPLENKLRLAGGEAGFSGGFIEEYIVSIIYPNDLTRGLQILLGSIVIVINVSVYGYLLWKRKVKALNRK